MKYHNILISGGAGFVGSNLAIYLKEVYPKTKISVFDNLKRRGSELNLKRFKEYDIEFIHGDIRCPEDFPVKNETELVIECSAEPSVLAGYENDPNYIINTNLTGSINCFNFARKNKADIIFISTSRVYPYDVINNLPFSEEETRFEWLSPADKGINIDFTLRGSKTLYGASKLASELFLIEYAEQFEINYIINRCGVLAGPWQFGKVDQGVFTFWLKAHQNKNDINYIGFGGDGKQVRDLLHINDFCILIDKQINKIDKINNQIFNVGGGRKNSLSLLETTKICRHITGNKIDIRSEINNRPGDIRIYYTDNFEVTKLYDWKPENNPEKTIYDIHRWLVQNNSF